MLRVASNTLPAKIRAHFGLTQAELAAFISVSRAHIASVESGRKALADAPRHRLWVLARALPPPNGQGPPAPDLGPATPPEPLDPEPLHDRLRRCRFLLAKARFELGQRGGPATTHARRRWAVQVLGPALSSPLAGYPGATPDPATDLAWLARLAATVTATPAPLTATARALSLARQRALEAEIAALEEALRGEA